MRVRGAIPLALTRVASLALTLALVGCGDPTLWARYRAERGSWHARKLVDRIRVNPRLATARDYERARAAFEAVVTGFPASVWGRATPPGTSRDVAVAAGHAAISIARLDELHGDPERAIVGYTRAEHDWRAVLAVALAAAVARAEAHERWGRAAEAAVDWREVATEFPLVDDERGATIAAVLEAPARAAALLRHAGRAGAADSVLAAAELREAAEAERRRGGPAAPELWARLADTRGARGDTPGALEALRAALFEPAARHDRARLVLSMARLALGGGRPDSARVYAAWADTGFGGDGRPEALMLTAEAWQAAGRMDSALAAYRRYLDEDSQQPDGSARARFQCGAILEQSGRWEQAHSEYRALQATQPTHPLSFASLLRIVNHHVSQGESDLAHLEARQAIERLDEILASQRDETVDLGARVVRAQLLVTLDRAAEACDALTLVWRRSRASREGAQAGLTAAALAEHELHDSARARRLYEEIAMGATDGDAREAARAAAERLRETRN